MTKTNTEKLEVLNDILSKLVKLNNKWESVEAKEQGNNFVIIYHFRNSKFFQTRSQVIPFTDIDEVIKRKRAQVFKYETTR